MNIRSFVFSSVLAVFAGGIADNINAQVFIPDLNMRDVLNSYIPGIVDVSGMMDTLDPVFGFTPVLVSGSILWLAAVRVVLGGLPAKFENA